MREFATVAEQIQKLTAMGVERWLDDFGTGHSSLEWLSHLPLSGVKIAGTFGREPRVKHYSIVIVAV